MGLPRKERYFFLSNKRGHTISVENGAIVADAQPTPLPESPEGWQDIQIAFGTNSKYWSLNRSFTIPLKFVGTGADILRYYIYNGKGYEEEIYVTILRWNALFVDTDGKEGRYELEYKGRIDFTKMKDDPITGVTVNTIEGGLLSYLNANDGIYYEIPCNATNKDCIKVQFDGVELFDSYNFSFIDIELQSLHFASLFAVPFTFINKEGDSVGIITGSPTYEEISTNILSSPSSSSEGANYANTSSNYFFSSSVAATYPLKGTIQFQKTADQDEGIEIFLKSSLGATIILYVGNVTTDNEIVTIDVNETISFQAEEKYFLLGYVQGGSASEALKIKFFETKLNLSTITINPPSISYALPPLQLGKQLVSKMTDGRYTMESNFFKAHNNIVASGGEAIRELPNAGLKTSFQDYFNYYNGKKNLGLQVRDNVLWIEPKADLYNDQGEIFDLGEVSEFSIGYAEEYLINSLQTGSPVQDYGERNGRFEYNDTVSWKLPVTAVNKELNLVSKWRDDCYGIEFIRGKLNNLDTTDNKGDNEVFAINIDTIGASSDVLLSMSKNNVDNVSGTLSFDTIILQSGGIENFLTFAVPFSSFTYNNDTSNNVIINFNAYGTKVGEEASFVLFVNGNPVQSVLIDGFITTFRATLDARITLNKGDVVTVGVTMEVDLTSCGITFQIDQANPTLIYGLKRETYDTLTGVPTATVYNIEEMTPKRMLLAHGNYLRGLLYQLPSEKITFQTADKNKDLSTTLNGLTITEKADVIVGTLPDPLFLPFELSFTTKVPYSFAKIMSKLSAGHIKFTYNGFPIYCLPIGDMKCKPVSEEAQEWKLLASPLNTLDTLIKLSQGATIIKDYMNNQLIISDLNPVHFVRYDCQKTEDQTIIVPANPPTGNQGLVASARNASWNTNGAKIYAPGYPLNGLGTVVAHLTTPHFWVNGATAIEAVNGSTTSNTNEGRMNQNGVWVEGNMVPGTTWGPADEWIGFSRKITLTEDKRLYIGIAGDGCALLKLNGTEIVNSYGANIFHPETGINALTWSIFPVDCQKGDVFIEMAVMNGSATFQDNPAGFACEIYDMTLNQLMQARSEADLNIIFRTRDMIGQPFDIGTTIGYSCADGWVLEKTTDGYVCVKTIKGNDCMDVYATNKYHFKGIYDDRFQARLDRYDSKAIYYQKWQVADFINLQFITAGYGALELQIFDCQARQVLITSAKVTPDTSLQSPYIKQEFSIDLSQLGTGVYQFVLAINGVYLVISEWQQVSVDLPDTLLIEYSNTKNKPDAYFKTWQPAVRIEGFLPPPTPESSSTTYEDEPGDTELLSGSGWMKQRVILGDGYGLPDFMAKKLNRILLLNRVFIEGVEYTKVGDAKLDTVELVQGYPMEYFTIDMRESKNTTGLVVSDVDLKNAFSSSLTLDAEAFGGAPGVIKIEID